MADRILTWYLDELVDDQFSIGPVHIMDRAYRPHVVRLHAKQVAGEDVRVDIRDDGDSIFGSTTSTNDVFRAITSQIAYNSQSRSGGVDEQFSIGETITGGSSSATATVGDTDGAGTLELIDVVGIFTVDETITGGTSGTTATVNAFVAPVSHRLKRTESTTVLDAPMLPKGSQAEDVAMDFPFTSDTIDRYSIVTLHLLSGVTNGLTVQLELIAEDDETAESDT